MPHHHPHHHHHAPHGPRGAHHDGGEGGGHHHRGPRHGDPEHQARKRERIFEAGGLKLIALHLIAQQPSHGYDLIRAIGEPKSLEASLKMRGGVIETLKFWGIQVTVSQEENVLVPAFKGTFRFDYAKAVQEGKS